MSARAWGAFAAVSILWGIPYLFIKIAVDDGVAPVFLAWVRVVLGAAVLIGLSWRLGLLGTLRGRWTWLAVFAVVEIVFPFPLIAFGEQHVASSLAAIIIASAPLFVALLALRFDHTERVTGSRLAGLLIGFAGVAALVGIDIVGDGDELLGAAAVLVAALGYAIGPMLLKRHFADLDPRVSMGASLAIAALVLTPAAALDPPTEGLPAEALISLAILGVLCTAAAFAIYASLVAEVGAGRALVITYIAPIVALVCGISFLDERPGAGALVGLALILVGSWLATRSGSPAEPPAGPDSLAAAAEVDDVEVQRQLAPVADRVELRARGERGDASQRRL